MADFEFFLQVVIETFTLFILLAGLLGLLIPVFPGLTVMWFSTLFYAIAQSLKDNMTGVDWLLFVLITLLMIGGNIIDNIIIAKHVREKNVIASPVGLFLAEWRRLKDRDIALSNTKAWMTGWGWSVAARLGIGFLMIVLWGLWAWL